MRLNLQMPDLSYERRIGGVVAGLDEVGRGPLCGPVVAAAVILPPDISRRLASIANDSKKLSPARREEVVRLLQEEGGLFGLGAASAREIEALNILKATFLAMRRALDRLPRRPDHVLVDGNRAPPVSIPCTTIVKGDSISLSIAVASNIAKVVRDRCMSRLAVRYPEYGWEKNAGYGVQAHRDAIVSRGITPHHRRGFGALLSWNT